MKRKFSVLVMAISFYGCGDAAKDVSRGDTPLNLSEDKTVQADILIDSANQKLDVESRAAFTTRPIDIRRVKSVAVFVSVEWPFKTDCYLSAEQSDTLPSPLTNDLEAEALFGTTADRLFPSNKSFILSGEGILEIPSPPGNYMAIRFSEDRSRNGGSTAPEHDPTKPPPPPLPFCKGKILVNVEGKK